MCSDLYILNQDGRETRAMHIRKAIPKFFVNVILPLLHLYFYLPKSDVRSNVWETGGDRCLRIYIFWIRMVERRGPCIYENPYPSFSWTWFYPSCIYIVGTQVPKLPYMELKLEHELLSPCNTPKCGMQMHSSSNLAIRSCLSYNVYKEKHATKQCSRQREHERSCGHARTRHHGVVSFGAQHQHAHGSEHWVKFCSFYLLTSSTFTSTSYQNLLQGFSIYTLHSYLYTSGSFCLLLNLPSIS